MPEDIITTTLPDGRIRLTWGKCIPVVLTAETYSRKSRVEVARLIAELTLNASSLAEKHGYDFPLATGEFVQEASGAERYELVKIV